MEANGRAQRRAGGPPRVFDLVRRGSHAAWTAWRSTRALPRSWSPASLFFLTGLIGDALVRERLPEKPVLNIAAAPAATGGGEASRPDLPPIAPLLASGRPGGR